MRSTYLFCIGLLMLTAACSKDNDDKTTPVPPDDSIAVIKTGVYTMANVAADTAANSATAAKPFYYSLEDQRVVPASQVQTNNWDIVFTGTYNSSIYANNGKAQYSPGFGGPGVGGIHMVIDGDIDASYYGGTGKALKNIPPRTLFDEAFNKVKTVPIPDADFKTNESIGLDYFSGSGSGWAYYDFYGSMFPEQPYDSVTHVCYNMPRTLIVRTAKGNYAKVIIYSLYKGAPELPTRSYKAGFITFKYAIQKDGSKNLDIQ
jgi:hypothetical protein